MGGLVRTDADPLRVADRYEQKSHANFCEQGDLRIPVRIAGARKRGAIRACLVTLYYARPSGSADGRACPHRCLFVTAQHTWKGEKDKSLLRFDDVRLRFLSELKPFFPSDPTCLSCLLAASLGFTRLKNELK